MKNQEKTDLTFPALTGVRAIAAYMVFIHHFPPDVNLVGPFLLSILKELHIGVTVFFVLSGFLIYLKYAEKSSLSKEFLFGFYKNRAARIYPVYFFLILCVTFYNFTIAKSMLGIRQELFNLFLQFTFIKGYSYQFFPIGIGQAWTLTVEETFYFLFPVFIIMIRKMGFIKPLLTVYFVGLILLFLGNTIQYQGFFQGTLFMTFYTFFGRAGEFFLGMWTAQVFINQDTASPSQNKFPIKTTAGFIGILLSLFIFTRRVPMSETAIFQPLLNALGQENLTLTIFVMINNLILPPFIALFFYGLLTEKSWIKYELESPLMVMLGKSSYIFYLIHLGFLQVIIINYISESKLVLFILINLFAIILFTLIEEPWRRLIRQVKMPKGWSTIPKDASPL